MLDHDLLEDALSLYKDLATTKEKTLSLIDLISKNPIRAQHLDCEAIMQGSLDSFPENASTIWLCIADYHIRLGDFVQARSQFDKAID